MASMRKAINDFCKSCIYDDKSGLGTWRQQTEGCTVTKCPLWALRPVSKQQGGAKSTQIATTNGPSSA